MTSRRDYPIVTTSRVQHPVCAMDVDLAPSGHRLVHDGQTFHLCSAHGRARLGADPRAYPLTSADAGINPHAHADHIRANDGHSDHAGTEVHRASDEGVQGCAVTAASVLERTGRAEAAILADSANERAQDAHGVFEGAA